jgi:hypothetical protein
MRPAYTVRVNRTRGDWIAIALLAALAALCFPSVAAFVRAGGAARPAAG